MSKNFVYLKLWYMQLFAIHICFQGCKSQKAYSATKTSKNFDSFIFALDNQKPSQREWWASRYNIKGHKRYGPDKAREIIQKVTQQEWPFLIAMHHLRWHILNVMSREKMQHRDTISIQHFSCHLKGVKKVRSALHLRFSNFKRKLYELNGWVDIGKMTVGGGRLKRKLCWKNAFSLGLFFLVMFYSVWLCVFTQLRLIWVLSFSQSRKIWYFPKNATFITLDGCLQPCSLVNVLKAYIS